MKKLLGALLILLLLFLGLIYISVSMTPEEIEISQVVESHASEERNLKSRDSVKVLATNQYEANRLKRFMQGVNYREAWSTPVIVPVASLDTMTIIGEGGGNQTKSLKLKGQSGILYSLRSINKNPDPLIPQAARILGLENIVIDGISAQHPFGALLAARISEAAGVLSTHPKLLFVPEQKALGNFSEEYGSRLYFLEYETEGEINWTSLPNILKIVETDQLQEMKMEHGEKLNVAIRSFIRARLLDLMIGDWDRHSKQWGWAIQQNGDHLTAFPVAGDRDNAFFRIDGVVPTILTNKLVQPMVRPFEKDIDHLPGFVYPVDTYFLQNIPEKFFVEEAKILQQKLTNKKIKAALQAWPPEIRRLNGEEIIEKLQQRREDLVKYAREFKKEIDKTDLLEKPLKGSEDLDLPSNLLKCFECR